MKKNVNKILRKAVNLLIVISMMLTGVLTTGVSILHAAPPDDVLMSWSEPANTVSGKYTAAPQYNTLMNFGESKNLTLKLKTTNGGKDIIGKSEYVEVTVPGNIILGHLDNSAITSNTNFISNISQTNNPYGRANTITFTLAPHTASAGTSVTLDMKFDPKFSIDGDTAVIYAKDSLNGTNVQSDTFTEWNPSHIHTIGDSLANLNKPPMPGIKETYNLSIEPAQTLKQDGSLEISPGNIFDNANTAATVKIPLPPFSEIDSNSIEVKANNSQSIVNYVKGDDFVTLKYTGSSGQLSITFKWLNTLVVGDLVSSKPITLISAVGGGQPGVTYKQGDNITNNLTNVSTPVFEQNWTFDSQVVKASITPIGIESKPVNLNPYIPELKNNKNQKFATDYVWRDIGVDYTNLIYNEKIADAHYVKSIVIPANYPNSGDVIVEYSIDGGANFISAGDIKNNSSSKTINLPLTPGTHVTDVRYKLSSFKVNENFSPELWGDIGTNNFDGSAITDGESVVTTPTYISCDQNPLCNTYKTPELFTNYRVVGANVKKATFCLRDGTGITDTTFPQGSTGDHFKITIDASDLGAAGDSIGKSPKLKPNVNLWKNPVAYLQLDSGIIVDTASLINSNSDIASMVSIGVTSDNKTIYKIKFAKDISNDTIKYPGTIDGNNDIQIIIPFSVSKFALTGIKNYDQQTNAAEGYSFFLTSDYKGGVVVDNGNAQPPSDALFNATAASGGTNQGYNMPSFDIKDNLKTYTISAQGFYGYDSIRSTNENITKTYYDSKTEDTCAHFLSSVNTGNYIFTLANASKTAQSNFIYYMMLPKNTNGYTNLSGPVKETDGFGNTSTFTTYYTTAATPSGNYLDGSYKNSVSNYKNVTGVAVVSASISIGDSATFDCPITVTSTGILEKPILGNPSSYSSNNGTKVTLPQVAADVNTPIYTVAFKDYKGATYGTPEKIIAGNCATVMGAPIPDANNYFMGWKEVGGNGTLLQASDINALPVNADITYIAVEALKTPQRLTVTAGAGGSVQTTVNTKDVSTAVATGYTDAAGDKVVAKAIPSPGYIFTNWKVFDASGTVTMIANPNSFIMPNNNVKLVANFDKIPMFSTRTEAFDTKGIASSKGAVNLVESADPSWNTTYDKMTLVTGDTATIQAKANLGYDFASWTPEDGSGNAVDVSKLQVVDKIAGISRTMTTADLSNPNLAVVMPDVSLTAVDPLTGHNKFIMAASFKVASPTPAPKPTPSTNGGNGAITSKGIANNLPKSGNKEEMYIGIIMLCIGLGILKKKRIIRGKR